MRRNGRSGGSPRQNVHSPAFDFTSKTEVSQIPERLIPVGDRQRAEPGAVRPKGSPAGRTGGLVIEQPVLDGSGPVGHVHELVPSLALGWSFGAEAGRGVELLRVELDGIGRPGHAGAAVGQV